MPATDSSITVVVDVRPAVEVVSKSGTDPPDVLALGGIGGVTVGSPMPTAGGSDDVPDKVELTSVATGKNTPYVGDYGVG